MNNIDENIKTLFAILDIREDDYESSLKSLDKIELSVKELNMMLQDCGKEFIFTKEIMLLNK